MHRRVDIVPVEQQQPMKAHPRALIVSRGFSHRGDPAHANIVVLVPTPIKQDQQPVKPVLRGSMLKLGDQQPAIRILTARPAMGLR